MANNRKKTRGRRFNYQPVIEKEMTAFGKINVLVPNTAKKVFQIPLGNTATHNTHTNSNYRY